MKITIEKGTHYSEVLDTLRKFLDENYKEYPILSKNLNIYFDLCNASNQICPDNKKEFKISGEQVTDVINQGVQKALKETKIELGNEVKRMERHLSIIERYLRLDRSYLATAEERGRKPENVKKREDELKKHLKELQDLQDLLKDYYYVINAVREGRYKGRAEIYNSHNYGRQQRTYVFYLDFDLPEFKGTYSIYKGLQRL